MPPKPPLFFVVVLFPWCLLSGSESTSGKAVDHQESSLLRREARIGVATTDAGAALGGLSSDAGGVEQTGATVAVVDDMGGVSHANEMLVGLHEHDNDNFQEEKSQEAAVDIDEQSQETLGDKEGIHGATCDNSACMCKKGHVIWYFNEDLSTTCCDSPTAGDGGDGVEVHWAIDKVSCSKFGGKCCSATPGDGNLGHSRDCFNNVQFSAAGFDTVCGSKIRVVDAAEGQQAEKCTWGSQLQTDLNFGTCEYTPDGSKQADGTWCCSADKHKCVYRCASEELNEEVKCTSDLHLFVGGLDPCRGRQKVCKLFDPLSARDKEKGQDDWMAGSKKYNGGACWGGLPDAPPPPPESTKTEPEVDGEPDVDETA